VDIPRKFIIGGQVRKVKERALSTSMLGSFKLLKLKLIVMDMVLFFAIKTNNSWPKVELLYIFHSITCLILANHKSLAFTVVIVANQMVILQP
jgi:hypothetical protein